MRNTRLVPAYLEEAVLITGARVTVNANEAVKLNLWLYSGRISFTRIRQAEDTIFDLDGCLILPGLINAHDHLEMNLFPRLGNGPYENAARWAEDIYHPCRPPIKDHLAVPKYIRLTWGAIKNLLSGVTTVAHHNPLHPSLFDYDLPIRVLKRFNWAHSLKFSPDWLSTFRDTPQKCPFIMHVAEGTDQSSRSELYVLDEAGALTESTVLVHGVAIEPSDLTLLSKSGAALVWCPSSNVFTLGRSLTKSVLDSGVPIALGTDSAMTAAGDMLDELALASRSVAPERLLAMVTSEAARILKMPSGFGRICHGGPADLLVIEDNGESPARSLLTKCPQLVIVKGRLVLVAAPFVAHRPSFSLNCLFPLNVEGRGLYWIDFDVQPLIDETKKVLNGDLRLAGRAVAA
jgi:cytosine/adenosine deaminase-related metal-dependent hydrolase